MFNCVLNTPSFEGLISGFIQETGVRNFMAIEEDVNLET